jgi:hypothetical protein
MEILKSISGNQRYGNDVTQTRRALLISTAHEPIAFIGYRRMISLMRREVAETLIEWEDDTILPNIKTPAVLKLKNFVLASTAHRMCSYNRNVVLARDEYKCQYCDKQLSFRESTIDHIFPRSRGGPNHWTNCVASCKFCNRLKNDRTPLEAGMKLLRRPAYPSVTHFWMANVQRIPSQNEWHPSWTQLVGS